MKECKYRLPCNWCDRFNKFCDMVDGISMTIDVECEHIWEFFKSVVNIDGEYDYHRCRRCGMMKATRKEKFND